MLRQICGKRRYHAGYMHSLAQSGSASSPCLISPSKSGVAWAHSPFGYVKRFGSQGSNRHTPIERVVDRPVESIGFRSGEGQNDLNDPLPREPDDNMHHAPQESPVVCAGMFGGSIPRLGTVPIESRLSRVILGAPALVKWMGMRRTPGQKSAELSVGLRPSKAHPPRNADL